MLWQLKKLSTNEALNKPGVLPENWGPIFGLAGIQDRLADLSWLGTAYEDMGWVQVEGDIQDLAEPVNLEKNSAAQLNIFLAEVEDKLKENLTVEEKAKVLDYQAMLLKVPTQKGYPKNIVWPVFPL